jgi:hypothetical protein
MQTTLRINDHTYQRAKTKASALGISLTRFFEEAVEERLARLEQNRPGKKIVLPVSTASEPPLSNEILRRRIEAAELECDLSQLRRIR